MVPGECLMLQPLEKAGEVASLVAKQGCTYLVVHSSSGAQEEVLLDEADQKLTGRFMLPPCLEGGHIVMNSVAAGRAMIVDAAIERALGEPLRESELEKQAEEALRKAAAQKQKKEETTLLTLISWKDGTPPENKSAAATTNQQKKKRSQQTADSSDEDESGIDEDGDGQSDTDEDGSDSEDDSDDEDDEPAKEEGGGCGQEEEEVA
mmetsp:Transcript_19111/g.47774  ORF Transcript_19111/g.47774 Transcript_19111/m.47774 type:complete len:207 (+) Transcript_19111:682-1302(+)